MRSIKQIIREVKKEVIKIIEEENNQDLVYLETDNYLDEENIENDMFDYENDSIEKLHDFIIENYNKDEITILFKYLITHFLSSNTELLTSYLLSDNNNNNTVYKNMITTRLRVIFEELNIFSPDILSELDEILKLILNENFIEDEEMAFLVKYIQNLVHSITEDTIYELCVDDKDYYYNILENYYISNEFITTEPMHIGEIKVNINKKDDITTLEDCANVILEELFYFQNYYTDYDDSLDTIDSILNEEQKVEEKFYKEYTKYIKDPNYVFDEKELINMMKVNVIKNYYKYKMGTGSIFNEEENLIENIRNHLDDSRVLIEIYDSDYDSSIKFLDKCIEYYHYQKEIDNMLNTNKYKKTVDNVSIINYKINKKLSSIQEFLNETITINADDFQAISHILDNNTIITLYMDDGESLILDKTSTLDYIKDNDDVMVSFEIDNSVLKTVIMMNYLIKTDILSEKEKNTFVISICEDYLKVHDGESDFLNILNNNSKTNWYNIFKEDEGLRFSVFNNHLQKLSSMNQKFNFIPQKKTSLDQHTDNIYQEILNDIIYQLKNDPLEYTKEEIIKILYNYLCDIVSVNEKYYQYYFANCKYNENILKFIFRFIIINNYYKSLKSKNNLDTKELNYIDTIENNDKFYVDALFSSNKNFYMDCMLSYFEDLKSLDENSDKIKSDAKTFKKTESFNHSKDKNEHN